jgi:hypothetical protein
MPSEDRQDPPRQARRLGNGKRILVEKEFQKVDGGRFENCDADETQSIAATFRCKLLFNPLLILTNADSALLHGNKETRRVGGTT